MHGPKPRSHAFKLNKKVRRLGLKIALSARVAEGKASLLSTPIIAFCLQIKGQILYIILSPFQVLSFYLIHFSFLHDCTLSLLILN